MKIGVIQASSQKDKNSMLYECVKKAVEPYGHEVINFGIFDYSSEDFSYVEIAICISLLLSSKVVDFIVTGCSSGQGMMLACNSLPNVLCGYTPTPQDAFLFGRINDGNAVSFPLGLNFGWLGEINLQCTLNKLFEGPFGTGYPPQEAERKISDTMCVKQMNKTTKQDWVNIIDDIEEKILKKALSYDVVYDYIQKNSHQDELKELIKQHLDSSI